MTTNKQAGKAAQGGEKKARAKDKQASTPKQPSAPVGRPSTFTQELADFICEQIADGKSLREVCSDDAMPAKSTVFRWLAADKVFCDQYARAREVQAETMADEILQIADDGKNDSYVDDEGRSRTDQDVIARSRLRVDARKWLASKLAPKKYGDKVAQEVSGPNGGPIQTESTVIVTAEEAYRRMIEQN